MKKAMLCVMLVCLLWLLGCATVRQGAIDISKEEMKNAETAREVAANYLTIWPIQSGFIKGALGPRLDELPAQAVDAMNELDQLATGDPNEVTDYDLGLSLGLRIRLLTSVVVEALEFYAPDILEFVPLLF